MRIIGTYDVSLTFTTNISDFKKFTIEKDNGERLEVKIINHPKAIQAFKWLNDNDFLRLLLSLEPAYQDNRKEVESAMAFNAHLTEHAYLLSGYRNVGLGSSSSHQTPKLKVPGVVPVPDLEYTITWTFCDQSVAVMFKVACG